MSMIYDLSNEYGGKIIGDTDQAGAALEVQSQVAGQPAVKFQHTVLGSQTVAPVQLAVPSVASGAVVQVTTGFISVTSVVLTTVANVDYVIPVQVGLETRYIPLFKAAAVIGGAAF